jgi:putative ABC transport system substrate-binding protein
VIFLITVLSLLAGPAAAYDVLVLQSQRGRSHDEVVTGFRSVCSAPERLLVLTDYAETDVPRIVREDRPQLVVAIGDAALQATRALRQVPVIALMSLGVHDEGFESRANLSGIDMYVQPEQYVSLFELMKAKRVGVIYSMARSGRYVKRAQAAAREVGVELLAREVHEPKDTLKQLLTLRGRVDAIWMIPDTMTLTRETAAAFFQFSQQEMVPLVSFSPGHLGLGAAAVLEIDRPELGRQGGELAQEILNGRLPAAGSLVAPRKVTIKANGSVLKRLGVAQLPDRQPFGQPP